MAVLTLDLGAMRVGREREGGGSLGRFSNAALNKLRCGAQISPLRGPTQLLDKLSGVCLGLPRDPA